MGIYQQFIEWVIYHGGLYVVLFIIFAETGLFIGFFLPGDSLFTTGIYLHEIASIFFNAHYNASIFFNFHYALIIVFGCKRFGFWNRQLYDERGKWKFYFFGKVAFWKIQE